MNRFAAWPINSNLHYQPQRHNPEREKFVGREGILRADGIGGLRTVLLIGNRPVDNRPQDAILPHGGDRYFAAV